LSVEEQFYLVIAPLLFFISRFNLGFQTVFLLTLLILPTCFRALGWYDSHNETHVRWDCCLMGVLLAHLYHKRAALWLRLLPFKGTMLIVGTMAYLSFYYFRLEPPYAGYSDPSKLLLAIVFASLVFYAVNTPVLHKPIGFNTIMHVSTRSYSIYLVHPEALAFCKRFLEGSDFLTFYLVAIGLTLIISEVLYRTVEVTFITMRSKYKFSSKRMA
jgi:peptidoglycan/LPS O-acetylase OafA/YrhL